MVDLSQEIFVGESIISSSNLNCTISQINLNNKESENDA